MANEDNEESSPERQKSDEELEIHKSNPAFTLNLKNEGYNSNSHLIKDKAE